MLKSCLVRFSFVCWVVAVFVAFIVVVVDGNLFYQNVVVVVAVDIFYNGIRQIILC